MTYKRFWHIKWHFYHGTKAALAAGDELAPDYGSNFHDGRVSNFWVEGRFHGNFDMCANELST